MATVNFSRRSPAQRPPEHEYMLDRHDEQFGPSALDHDLILVRL